MCARYVRTAPARPANPYRARELGHTVAMDFSYHTTPSGEQLMILHFIDEASKYHTAKIIREGAVRNFSDLGNCDALTLPKRSQNGLGTLRIPPASMLMKRVASILNSSKNIVD